MATNSHDSLKLGENFAILTGNSGPEINFEINNLFIDL